MKIVDGLCPYCSEPVKEKPGKVTKQINCVSCGRLLNLPSVFTDDEGNTQNYTTLEPGLLFSFIVGLAFVSGHQWVMMVATILGCVSMFMLWTQDDIPGVPDSLRGRVIMTTERLRIFPFELYLAGGWILMQLLVMMGFYMTSGIVLCVVMFAAAWMAIQANRFYRESKVTSSKLSLMDFSVFIQIMSDPTASLERKKSEKGEGETYSTSHFTMAAEEKMQKDERAAENFEEIARLRGICINERKKWEEEIDERYNTWLEEEYSRLQSER